VFFNSWGWRLHPNLYADGKVCLSLLGTWSGDEVENWNPRESNILQLVVSLQGLILGVKEPYFLEAGYEKQKGTTQGSISSKLYNERALLLSLKLMARVYENPPPEFQEVIHQYFHFAVKDILSLKSICSYLVAHKGYSVNGNEEQTLGDNDKQIAMNTDGTTQQLFSKFFIPPNPSLGLLQPLITTVLPKFESLSN